MSDLSAIFRDGAKVVISPDKMRAWVTLPPPAKGVKYTAEAITEWLPQHGVTYGADPDLIRRAVASEKYDDLLEVARGKAPVSAVGGNYTLKIEKRPFTGLNASGDGALIYDDLSFLQEVQAGQVLAEVVPPVLPEDGMTVTGEVVHPREGTAGRALTGSGYVESEDGRTYLSPVLGHVNIVNEQLVVTPVLKLAALSKEDGPVEFSGNVLVEGDVTTDASINATGSVFIAGRCLSASIKAGNNVLISGGLRSEGGFGSIEAKGNVWGQFFESCRISAGGDICANHLSGVEGSAGGRASIAGGTGAVTRSTLYVKGGMVTSKLGDPSGGETVISAGLEKDFIEKYAALQKRVEKLTIEIQATQQNITTHERVNRMKADKGKGDAAYKEMVKKRVQSLSVLKILDGERTRMKRTMDAASNTSVVVRDTAYPGVTIIIDNRSLTVKTAMNRTKFHRVQDAIEAVSSAAR